MGAPIVVDTSVLMSILLAEPDADALIVALSAADERWIGTPTRLEAGIVTLRRHGPRGLAALARLCRALDIDVIPFGAPHASAAEQAYLRYGKGRHPAALNFGDCCAYAVSSVSGRPLLFKGADFDQTDVAVVDWA